MSSEYKRCTRCIMDTSASDIRFDRDGVCSFCTEFLQNYGRRLHATDNANAHGLERLVSEIKLHGARNRYDCVVGVSGGMDSSWVLHKAVRLGLRPLAVHMDNGWNSELAQSNIENLVKGLGVDLYTHVIDWNEYRNLMQTFLNADVIDIELLYDNAMLAVNYQQAANHSTRYILGGTNIATEGMRLPDGWNWFKWDKRQIRAMAKHSPSKRLVTFPAIGTMDFVWYTFAKRIRWVSLLDFLAYNKANGLSELQRLYQYKPYPYKHYESVFTRFYQGYLLPSKFQVDKRLVHLSTLVASGQMQRDEALVAASGIAYPSESSLMEDKLYFLKKMGWDEQTLDEYVQRPPVNHAKYPTEKPLWLFLESLYRRYRSSFDRKQQ